MKTYIVLLRGINVSGKNSIKMVDLRLLLSGLGFRNVVTYIQSGNIVLDADLSEKQDIENLVLQAINTKFGYDVNVLVLTRPALLHVFNNNPFLRSKDVKKLAVTLLNDEPDLTHLDYLKERADLNGDVFVVDGKCLYMHYPNGQGRSKLTHAILEKKLNSKATSRNWNTITKLIELSDRYIEC